MNYNMITDTRIETRLGCVQPELRVDMKLYLRPLTSLHYCENTIVIDNDHDKPVPLITPLDRVHPEGEL